MNTYLNLLKYIKNTEQKNRPHRYGHEEYFRLPMRFNLADGFPLLTTKKIHIKSVIYELLWFLKGDTNIKYLNENGVTIWDEWADENGDLGVIYGSQWRNWKGADNKTIDQISEVIRPNKN